MDAFDLIKWREMHYNLDRRAASKAMGIGLNSLRNYEEGTAKIPPYIPLVCAAIAAGLGPWELPADLKREKAKTPVIKPSVMARGTYPRPAKESATNGT